MGIPRRSIEILLERIPLLRDHPINYPPIVNVEDSKEKHYPISGKAPIIPRNLQ